ncbi:hypothetical protein [Rhodospirillum sp. A1_3_36]|uniref:hypothetical protein n=1 Tax=Rhodospirillum sp. A1_3_36 TaxID=3391666 RepID=UPI0039A554B0
MEVTKGADGACWAVPRPVVEDFRLILTWPLALRDRVAPMGAFDGGKIHKRFLALLNQPDSPWRRQDNRLKHARGRGWEGDTDPRHTPEEYAEYVYFYPFVQKFLYDSPQSMAIHRRGDVTHVDLWLADGKDTAPTARLVVDRLAIHSFRTGDVVVVTELRWDPAEDIGPHAGAAGLPLALVMELTERVRHVYPPFFYTSKDKPPAAAQTLARMTWQGVPGTVPAEGISFTSDGVWERIQGRFQGDRRQAPIGEQWLPLLPDLSQKNLVWHQIQDDRMTCLTFLGLDHPERLTEVDWVRLGNVDEAGKELPYGRAFLEDFVEKSCYDRFWDPEVGFTTRYVCMGFSFVVVTKNGQLPFLAEHFRRHYFQMALVSQFQLSALHNISDRLTDVIGEYAEDGGVNRAETRRPLDRILQSMLEFTHVFWFTEITNQIQGRELFDLWRKHLGIERLHAQVSAEVREAKAFVDRLQDERIAGAAERFNWIATLVAVLGVTVGFLGMNIIVPSREASNWGDWPAWGAGAFVLAGALFVAIVMHWGLSWRGRSQWCWPGGWYSGFLVLVAVFFCLGCWLTVGDGIAEWFAR